MSVTYNIIQRGEPGVAGGGTKKYYASSVTNNTIGIEELTSEIAKLSTVNGADISAVLYGIVEVLTQLLAKGNSIQLGDLGYFRIGISSDPSDTEEEVSTANIRRIKVLFRPGRKIGSMLKAISFKKA